MLITLSHFDPLYSENLYVLLKTDWENRSIWKRYSGLLQTGA